MDKRDRAAIESKWYKSFDESRMIAKLDLSSDEGDDEEVEVPVSFAVCDTCDGKGKHVNPSIDSNGLSAEDFAEDPDFAENYFGGMYDVTCYGCEGKRVVPKPDFDSMNNDIKNRLNEHFKDLAMEARERAAEIRYGY